MASYETETTLAIQDAIGRARDFFEKRHHLTAKDRLGALQRWRGVDGDVIELRAFPKGDGGTRLEIDTLRHDDIVLAFVKSLPREGWLTHLWRRLRG